MKNAKRILALLSAAVMLFGFASCKGNDEPTATSAPAASAAVTETTTAEET
ncbi:MAG TPA: sugar-binding protein, partial [Ruminococcaceae bacterium]|nr:sugar-binding protein [Oscillospiraceae bacterium]